MSTLENKGSSLLLNLTGKDKLNGATFNQLKGTGFVSCVPLQVNGAGTAVKYNLDGLISLQSRFKNVMTSDELHLLLYNVYKSLLFLFNGNHRVHPNFIDYTADLVFIDKDGEIRFLVYPLELKTVEGGGIYILLASMIKHMKPFESRDEQAVKYLKDMVQAVEVNKASRRGFLTTLYSHLSDYYINNLMCYTPETLHSIVEGNPIKEPTPEQEDVKNIMEFNGVKMDLSHVDIDIAENTYIQPIEEDNGMKIAFADVSPVAFIGTLKRDNGELYAFDTRDSYYSWYFGKKPKQPTKNGEVAITLNGNKYISRMHFKIELEDSNNKFYLTDLHSANGTYVDGVRCDNSTPVELVDGSLIKVAGESMFFTLKEV